MADSPGARWALLLCLPLAACSAETADLAPLDWQRVDGPGPGGSVLGLGSAGAFDERGNFTVRAFLDGSVYRLYYGGSDASDPTGNGSCPGINGTHWRIGTAESADGLTWTRVAGSATGGAVLDNGSATDFDSQITYRPFVLKDGSLYRMWFNGSTKFFNCPTGTRADNRRIGYAESSDGVAWTKLYDGGGPGGSVLPLGGAGAIDEQQVGYVWVLQDGPEYKMYYSANDASNNWRVGLAVSRDARSWTKVPGKLAGGAVLGLGAPGSLDGACAYQPAVVKERDQLYRMWYRGCSGASNAGPSGGSIGYAESNDGITWVKIPQPGPAGAALGAGPAGRFDAAGLTTPSVFRDAQGWVMYYAGFDPTGRFLTGVARARP
ncbi:MAG: hypothetical protein HZB56_17085 [Deltaproteobacteria bacterium]|nr:hypothetical protein [Deltaproteobacteria bacterium]